MDIFRKRTRETAEAIKEAVGEAIQKSKVRDVVDFATITNADAINAFKTNHTYIRHGRCWHRTWHRWASTF